MLLAVCRQPGAAHLPPFQRRSALNLPVPPTLLRLPQPRARALAVGRRRRDRHDGGVLPAALAVHAFPDVGQQWHPRNYRAAPARWAPKLLPKAGLTNPAAGVGVGGGGGRGA